MVGMLGCGCCGPEPCPNDNLSNFTDDFDPTFDPYWVPSGSIITLGGKCQLNGQPFPSNANFSQGFVNGVFRKFSKLGTLISVSTTIDAWGSPNIETEIGIATKSTTIQGQTFFISFNARKSTNLFPPPPIFNYYEVNGPGFSVSVTPPSEPSAGPQPSDQMKLELTDFVEQGLTWEPSNNRYLRPLTLRVYVNDVVRWSSSVYNLGVLDFCSVPARLRLREDPIGVGGKVKVDDFTWFSN